MKNEIVPYLVNRFIEKYPLKRVDHVIPGLTFPEDMHNTLKTFGELMVDNFGDYWQHYFDSRWYVIYKRDGIWMYCGKGYENTPLSYAELMLLMENSQDLI